MTKKQEIAIHLGFWILFFGMSIYFDIIKERDFTSLWDILVIIDFSLLQLTIFYLNYLWICPKTIPQKKWGWLILGQIFLLFLFPAIRHLFEEVLIFQITGKHNYSEISLLTPFYVYDNSYYAIRIILYSLVFYFIKTIWNNNQKMNDLLLQKKQAELQNLKNQLSPHFMFNTLNSFYADLMDVDAKTAKDLLKLSDMLRYITYENENDEVYLKDEIQFIQNYIDLFSRRFDNQLAVVLDSDIDSRHVKIPSLLLIHFVENAFKHGITSNLEKPIEIRLKTTESELLFSVENYFMSSENYDEKGIGYKNIQQRLEILFSENYILDVTKTQETYHVKLQIPLSQ